MSFKCKFIFFNNKRNPDSKPKLSMNGSQMTHTRTERDIEMGIPNVTSSEKSKCCFRAAT